MHSDHDVQFDFITPLAYVTNLTAKSLSTFVGKSFFALYFWDTVQITNYMQ